MTVGRSLFKIRVIRVGLGVINQGDSSYMDVLYVTDILGYNPVFHSHPISLSQVQLMGLYVTDLAVEHINKLKCKREERTKR